MIIQKEFTFEAAHWLEGVGSGHPCARMHGHSYRVTLQVTGPVVSPGWVCDFGELKVAWRMIEPDLDHRCLNEVDGMGNPTSENLAVWIWERIKPILPNLATVIVSETPTSRAIYEGVIWSHLSCREDVQESADGRS